ncbi:LytR/AlgR family response regulator transcription factor [Chitinophaga rhizophila]|uniref:LytTR family transcriptional regulator n=1 Tax=Chitinophaga rhizophila TaxID=2866212 RepID=A0ABS7GAJ0_9BACT|nr:LytTR family DNA-binding domain-containing protein [Chitinophaga rhizophila]MBW8684682.1 LytTR family transcriptional regulator [Chitinophaga rhizophila]
MRHYFLILSKDARREMISDEEIVYATVKDKYVQAKLPDQRTVIIRTSLQKFETSLPPNVFLRIHKSYIVRINFIKYVKNTVIMKTGDELPLSKEFKDDFLDNFSIF